MKEFFSISRTIFPAIFRVVIGLTLLFDLSMTYDSASILYGNEFNSFYSRHAVFQFLAEHIQFFYLGYALLLMFFILGIGKNLSSLGVFVFYLLHYKMTEQISTWGDVILLFTLLFFIFADSFQYLSVRKSSRPPSLIAKLAVVSILLNLFVIYLNNAYYKGIDTRWQEGVAVYYSFAQYDHFMESWVHPIIAHEWLSKSINYSVILLQLAFTPLVIWRQSRYWILGISALIHLVMMFQFGLWKFEWVILLLYGFVLSDREWRAILPKSLVHKFFTENIDDKPMGNS